MSAYLNNVSYVNSLGKKWPLPLLLPDLKKFSKEVIWSLSDTMCNLIFVQETSKLQQNYLVRLFFLTRHRTSVVKNCENYCSSTNVFLYFTGVGGNKTLRRKESKIVSERFWNKKCSSYERLTKQATFFTTENNTAIISLVDSLPSTQQLKSKQKIFYDICPHSRPHSEPNDRIFVR